MELTVVAYEKSENFEDGFVVSETMYDKLKLTNFKAHVVTIADKVKNAMFVLRYNKNKNKKQYILNNKQVFGLGKRLKHKIKYRIISSDLKYSNFDYDGDLLLSLDIATECRTAAKPLLLFNNATGKAFPLIEDNQDDKTV